MALKNDEQLKAEESMEEILHSIRDIIAEEEQEVEEELPAAKGQEKKSEPGKAASKKDDDDVLELTEVVDPGSPSKGDVLDDIDVALGEKELEPEKPAPEAQKPQKPPALEEAPKEEADDTAEEEAPEEEAEKPPVKTKKQVSAAQKDTPPGGLLSREAAGSVSQSLSSLLGNIPGRHIDSPTFRDGLTIEDLVVETLKPMLKLWLDENLPVIVEDLVQKEIRKLVPRE